MISLEGIVKKYRTRTGVHTVLDGVTLKVGEGEKIGILGRNGAGKSTLIRIISGAELPNAGYVHREMSVSWPLAFSGAFQGSLTGVDNVRFLCRVYKADFNAVLPFVEDFAELGKFLREPVKIYSSGMQARLAFAISMAIEFDCFLIDEVIAVGDGGFRERCHNELFSKRHDRSLIIVSHHPDIIRMHCQRACILENGQLIEFPDVESAYHHYNHERRIVA